MWPLVSRQYGSTKLWSPDRRRGYMTCPSGCACCQLQAVMEQNSRRFGSSVLHGPLVRASSEIILTRTLRVQQCRVEVSNCKYFVLRHGREKKEEETRLESRSSLTSSRSMDGRAQEPAGLALDLHVTCYSHPTTSSQKSNHILSRDYLFTEIPSRDCTPEA